MPESSPPPPPSTLNLSIPSSGISIPVQEVLSEDLTSYDALLRVLRDATCHTRRRLSTAIELADMMETARAALKTIRETLQDPRVDAWRPSAYDSKKLMEPGLDLSDPDCYFSKHATPKARVRFRITSNISKEIYFRAKRLDDRDRLKLCSMYDSEDYFDSEDNHKEISEWIGRFTLWLESKKSSENEPRKTTSEKPKQGKRKRPLQPGISSKRKAIPASSNQATMQRQSVRFEGNNAQVADTTNQDMPCYQRQPAQQTVRQEAFLMHNLAPPAATYQEGPMTLGHYLQEQQSPHDSALQLGQQQEEQQDEQQEQQQQGQQQGHEQEQQSIDFLTNNMGDFYREFLYQYNSET